MCTSKAYRNLYGYRHFELEMEHQKDECFKQKKNYFNGEINFFPLNFIFVIKYQFFVL